MKAFSMSAVGWRRATLAIAALFVLSCLALETALWSLGPPPLGEANASSTIVVDRRDRLLRAFTTPDGRWRLPVTSPRSASARHCARPASMPMSSRTSWRSSPVLRP